MNSPTSPHMFEEKLSQSNRQEIADQEHTKNLFTQPDPEKVWQLIELLTKITGKSKQEILANLKSNRKNSTPGNWDLAA